jgi:Response regulator containing CheY-like receiver, AAA-type ATPase, and DNA-binding domains
VRSVLRGAGVASVSDGQISPCVPRTVYDPASAAETSIPRESLHTPTASDEKPLVHTHAPANSLADYVASPSSHPPGTPARVLLVEDDTDSRDALCDLLGALGLDCTAVGSAEEALPLVPAQRFDVLFTDLTLPGMSGDNLARAVLSRQPDIRVLLVSGYGENAEIGDTIPGARMLGKPLDISQLRRELAEWLDHTEAAS